MARVQSARAERPTHSSIFALMMPSGCAGCRWSERPTRFAMYGVTLLFGSSVMSSGLASSVVAARSATLRAIARAVCDGLAPRCSNAQETARFGKQAPPVESFEYASPAPT